VLKERVLGEKRATKERKKKSQFIAYLIINNTDLNIFATTVLSD